jgi:hypothetical protein
MIYNKSVHPVEVKKISIRLWSLRDEIEAAIGRRMKECEAAGVPLFIDDIKKFYNLNVNASLTEQDNVLLLHGKKKEGEGIAELMESVAPPQEPNPEPATAPVDPIAPVTASSAEKTFTDAETIIAEQTQAGLETKKPNPILQRPYQRQAPDLEKISYGFTLLSDINMDFFLGFTKDKFLQGQSVVVEFLIPQNFMMTLDVAYCHHYAMRSKIISSTKPDYRLQCRFTYAIPGERETLRSFLKSIEPDLSPETEKKNGKKEGEEDSLGL